MTISSKSRYAVRALVELDLRTGGEPRPVRVTDLASERELPGQFLEQQFAALRRAGLLRSHRGANGGFSFARRPEGITVLQVVEALDGPPTLAASGERHDEDLGGAGAVWQEAEQALLDVLAATTIADLAERERQLCAGAPMYQI